MLFIDNRGAHPEVRLSNIKMVFLPPKITSRLQPRKTHYRKRLMRHVLAEMDGAWTATELSKRVYVLDAIRWLYLSWASDRADNWQVFC